jgi:hypothetical protein
MYLCWCRGGGERERAYRDIATRRRNEYIYGFLISSGVCLPKVGEKSSVYV